MPEMNELLVKLQIDLGYEKVSKAGTCHGFEMMGLLAFLSRDENGNHQLPLFHERNKYIKAHPQFVEEITPVLAKLTERNKIIETQKILSEPEKAKFELTKEEVNLYEHYIDIRAYLDCMRLLQDPKVYHYIFGEQLHQSNLMLAVQLAQSLMVEAQGAPVLIGSITGIYTITELTNMIGELRRLLNANSQDGVLSIGSSFHALGVCYESKRKEWHLLNANKEHMPYPCYNNNYPSQLDKLMAEFIGLESEIISKIVLDKDPNHLFLLGMDIISSEQNEQKMCQVFEEFKKTDAYKNAQVITKEKANYKDKDGFGLLPMAIRHKELETFNALRNFSKAYSDRRVLNIAALTNSPEIIDTLGSQGVDLNKELIPYNFGMIAHEAAKNGNLQMLRVIDRHHGDLNQKDLLRRTPLDLAKKYHRTEVILFLKSVQLRDKLISKINSAIKKKGSFIQQSLEILREKVIHTWEAGNLTKTEFENFVRNLSMLKKQASDSIGKSSAKLFKNKQEFPNDKGIEEEAEDKRRNTISDTFNLKIPSEK